MSFGSLLVPPCICCKGFKDYWGYCSHCKEIICNDCGDPQFMTHGDSFKIQSIICHSCNPKSQMLLECCTRRIKIELFTLRGKFLTQSLFKKHHK